MGTRVIARRYTLDVPERPRPGCAVWRGRDTTTGAAVTITLLDGHAEADGVLAGLVAVRHPSLPVVLDHGVDGDTRWLVTPERSGVTARARLGDRLEITTAADVAAALADALAALHALGLSQGPFDLDAVVLDEVGPPRLDDLATGALARPADQPDDDVRRLAALLRDALGVSEGVEPLEVAGMPPRLAGLLQSMASIAPPTAAAARDALRRIARDAEAGDGDPFPPAPVAAAPSTAETAPRRRWPVLLVGALALAVLVLAAVVVAREVDRRDAAERAAATSLPGPIETITPTNTVEGGSFDLPTDTAAAVETATAAETTAAPVGPDRTPRPLRIARISALDPAGDIDENGDQARRAIDRSPRTGWPTELYKEGVIERKAGVGLQLVLATPARVRRVVIRSAPAGATVRIYAVRGALPARAPRDWAPASEPVRLARSRAVVPVDRVAPATALLVWVVGLPPLPGGYGVRLDDVRVIGVPTGA